MAYLPSCCKPVLASILEHPQRGCLRGSPIAQPSPSKTNGQFRGFATASDGVRLRNIVIQPNTGEENNETHFHFRLNSSAKVILALPLLISLIATSHSFAQEPSHAMHRAPAQLVQDVREERLRSLST